MLEGSDLVEWRLKIVVVDFIVVVFGFYEILECLSNLKNAVLVCVSLFLYVHTLVSEAFLYRF